MAIGNGSWNRGPLLLKFPCDFLGGVEMFGGRCPECGADYALVGRVHLCRPRATPAVASSATKSVAATESVACPGCVERDARIAHLEKSLADLAKRVVRIPMSSTERSRRRRAKRKGGGG